MWIFSQAEEGENSLCVDTSYSIDAQRTGSSGVETSAWNFKAIGFTTTGTVTGAVLNSTGATGGDGLATSSNNLYFTGGSVTFTSASISAPTASDGKISTLYAFVVQDGEVTFSGSDVSISELGLNLCIGTGYSSEEDSSSTLNITNGASVTTSAYYSTVGSTGSTGTINISGSGSTLATQQITLGGSIGGLTAATVTSGSGYYAPNYLMTDDQRSSVYDTAVSSSNATSGAKGYINITGGGTMTVGIGNTSSSTNKLQIMNGEVTVSGSGSSLIFGENSALNVQGNYGETSYFSSKLTITNGGSVKNNGSSVMAYVSVGATNYGSSQDAAISVSGSGSSLDLTAGYVYLGSTSSTVTSGAMSKVTLTASDGATFKLATSSSSTGYIMIGYDPSGYKSSGQTINISASGGSTMTFSTADSTASYANIYVGYYQPASESTNTINISATGSGTTLNFSTGSDYYTVFGVYGGESESYGGVDVAVSITEGAALTTAGTVFVSGDTAITIDKSSSWTSSGKVSLCDTSVLNLSVTASSGGNTATFSTSDLGISGSAKIAVTVDVSDVSTISTTDALTVSLISLTDASYTAESTDFLSTVSTALEVTFVSNSATVSGLEYTVAISDSVLVLTVVPEPSAFGVLAGLGALALVAARRRRRRVAPAGIVAGR